jgi:formylglycine-generating enzyme required for sulfatase activity
MAGNVSEWTDSSFDANTRVSRGGCWGNVVASLLRVGKRAGLAPSTRISDVGFRCAR